MKIIKPLLQPAVRAFYEWKIRKYARTTQVPRPFCDGRRQATDAAGRNLSWTFFAAVSVQNRDVAESSYARSGCVSPCVSLMGCVSGRSGVCQICRCADLVHTPHNACTWLVVWICVSDVWCLLHKRVCDCEHSIFTTQILPDSHFCGRLGAYIFCAGVFCAANLNEFSVWKSI